MRAVYNLFLAIRAVNCTRESCASCGQLVTTVKACNSNHSCPQLVTNVDNLELLSKLSNACNVCQSCGQSRIIRLTFGHTNHVKIASKSYAKIHSMFYWFRRFLQFFSEIASFCFRSASNFSPCFSAARNLSEESQ